ncbi:MAG: hypothetical protein AAGE94_13905 [Acidobacteriota bacterium]
MIESPMTYGLRRVDKQRETIDATPYFDVLDNRFGIPQATFEPYLVHRPNRQAVWIVRRDLQLPERPELHTIGIPFFRAEMRWPRPTTGAAIRWGGLATRHRVQLDAVEISRLLARDEVPLSRDRTDEIEGTGYVLLCHLGAVLGLGFFHTELGDESPHDAVGRVRAMLPRSWTTQLGVEAPAVEPPDWRAIEQPVTP